MDNVRKEVYLILFIFMLLPNMEGCKTAKHKHKAHQERILGTIETGGQFARAETMVIPESGLTLGQAVERSLRPGITTLAVQPAVVKPPLGMQEPSFHQFLEASLTRTVKNPPTAAQITDLAKSIVEHKYVQSQSSDTDIAAVEKLLNMADKNGLFKEPVNVVKIRTLAVNIENTLRVSQSEPAPQILGNVQTGIYNRIVVVLTRQNGRRIIVPLWMVQMFQAGDIWLKNQDRVQVVNYKRTEVGGRQQTDRTGSVVVTGLTSLQDSFTLPIALDNISKQVSQKDDPRVSDVIVLKHLSAAGILEEYFIPRVVSGSFGEDPEYNRLLVETQLGNGDLITFENMELIPLIREGRLKSVIATGDIITGEIGTDNKNNSVSLETIRSSPTFNTLKMSSENTRRNLKNFVSTIPRFTAN